MSTGSQSYPVERWQRGEAARVQDLLAEEVAVALVYNGISHAVMMSSPLDLADFALGFSLTEGIIARPDQCYGIEVVEQCNGIEVQIEIASECFAGLKQRRRNLTGRTGCGLCGAESLQQAVAAPVLVSSADLPSDAAVERALQQLTDNQPLQSVTGAVHGAGWCSSAGDILLLREDVGRHNALDKLIGALQGSGLQQQPGFVLVSSRASYEIVNKCAAAGIANLVAVSAPTSLALEHAKAAGINLIGFARPGRHVVYHRAGGHDQTSELARLTHVSE
nr:formate dehydrogenase accessory sulfurtransferase FdhD [Oceanobacter mangrovi]